MELFKKSLIRRSKINFNVETAGTFGSWSLVDSTIGGLPQDVASGIYVAFENRTEKVTPIYYFGYQLVNGMNHCLVCRRERTQGEGIIRDYVTVVINIPPKIDGYKETKLVSMEVAEETILFEEAKKAFDEKVAILLGTTHNPLFSLLLSYKADKYIKWERRHFWYRGLLLNVPSQIINLHIVSTTM